MTIQRRSGYNSERVWFQEGLVCGICDLPLELAAPVFVTVGDVLTQNPFGFSEDHIIPRFLGGDDSFDNLQPAHMFCNESRGSRFLSEEVKGEIRSKLLEKAALIGSVELKNSMECKTCGVEFHASPARIVSYGRSYCSVPCQHEGFRRRVELQCRNCGNSYEEILSRAARSNYCSKLCYSEGKSSSDKDSLVCVSCSAVYFLAKTNTRLKPRSFCSNCRKS